ncbi:hypothetical protein U1737_04385 [Sphingomonas sp. LB3N6]|uniref:hypothetical protein n=1 Tax=Sphingomonas fucosidasi TaxID=3096164 RepID=UPI002FC805C2
MATFKRKVFYLGGFDPRGVRFYYNLAKDQLGRYAEKTGEAVTVSRRRKASSIRSDWTIRNDTVDAITEYSFLRWEDIVQQAWIRNPVQLARRAARVYADHARLFDFAAVRKIATGPLVTMLYPPILSILLPLLLAVPLVLIALMWLPWWLALPIGLVLGAAASIPLLNAIRAPWLLRFFVFNGEFGDGEGSPALQARLDAFVDEIAQDLHGEYDEVLLISHSNGSILAMLLMARLLARYDGKLPANFVLVTYGHCIPLVACRRDAVRFHARLRYLSRQDFRWIDIGSPPDGAAFFGANPLLLVEPSPNPRIELLSPRFHRFYEPETYHKGWRNKYEIHFDYLRVGDRVSPLDLPSLTASSRSIEAAVAAFRTIA